MVLNLWQLLFGREYPERRGLQQHEDKTPRKAATTNEPWRCCEGPRKAHTERIHKEDVSNLDFLWGWFAIKEQQLRCKLLRLIEKKKKALLYLFRSYFVEVAPVVEDLTLLLPRRYFWVAERSRSMPTRITAVKSKSSGK